MYYHRLSVVTSTSRLKRSNDLRWRVIVNLGRGVWSSRPQTLDRHVAIKVLPAPLANDPERLARFEREAKVLALLNHPNIAHIYGVEDRRW